MNINPTHEYELKEAATLTGIPASSLRRAINSDGTLKGRLVPWGKREKWLVQGDALIAYLGRQSENLPLCESIEEWVHNMESGTLTGKPFSPETIRAYRYGLQKLITLAGVTSPRDVTAKALAAALSMVPTDHEKRKCHHSVKNIIHKACISFARFLGAPQSEIEAMRRLAPRRAHPPRKTVATASQVEALLEIATQKLSRPEEIAATRLFILLLAVCGLRISEAVDLEMKDVDTDRGILWVRSGKGGKDRMVPYPKDVAAALESWLKLRPKGAKHLVVSKDGSPFTRYRLNRQVRRWGAVIGLEITPHGLRRSAATIWHNNRGMSLDRVRRLLGHSRIATTQAYLMEGEEDLMAYIHGVEAEPGAKEPTKTGLYD